MPAIAPWEQDPAEIFRRRGAITGQFDVDSPGRVCAVSPRLRGRNGRFAVAPASTPRGDAGGARRLARRTDAPGGAVQLSTDRG